MVLWIILAIVVVAVIYVIAIYNRLVSTRQMSEEAWSGIDVQLKRRADLVPNLIETVKGYASHERGVFDEVTRLRTAVQSVPPGDVEARAKAEAEIARREEKMADPGLFTRDPAAFNRLAAEMEKLRGSLAKMEEEWLELEMLREELEG